MLFSFLRYVKPTWYFNLRPKQDYAYFPSQEQLLQNSISFEKDLGYQSAEACERDLAWTAFQRGVIQSKPEAGLNVWNTPQLPLADEYRFLRKNVHVAWVVYTLVLRVFTFHNPFAEFTAFWKTRHVSRFDYANQALPYTDYDSFTSPLLAERPFISVVIPTLNRYTYLKDVLRDLERQTYTHFEVIVVDQSEPFDASFYEGWHLDLHFWYQKEKALWKARNEAIQKAKGSYILLYDDDSLVDPDWIEHHLKTLDFFQADLSSGVSLSVIGAEIPKHYRYFRWSDQLDTGNVLLKKSIFESIGYFDLQFEKQRMGDGEYGLRCYLNGYKNISNCKANRIHLKVSEGGLRQMGSWDGWRPKKLLGPRPVPSVLYLSRKYFGTSLSRYYILQSILPSLVPYRLKKNKFLLFLSFVFIPLLLPLVLFQVFKSWRMSSKMLAAV